MKPGIHPSYQAVIFHDTAANHSFLTRASIDTKGRETMKWTDGKEYPVVKVEISSESHPHYQAVIFHDTAANHSFLTRASIDTKGRETMKWTDGKEYPVIKVEISSESHPHYTGKQKIMDTAGRVEKFKRRYSKKTPA